MYCSEPLGRVELYRELVMEILRETPPSHPDTDSLKHSKDVLAALATYIATTVDENSSIEELSRLEGCIRGLPFPLHKHGRRLIRRGTIAMPLKCNHSCQCHTYGFRGILCRNFHATSFSITIISSRSFSGHVSFQECSQSCANTDPDETITSFSSTTCCCTVLTRNGAV